MMANPSVWVDCVTRFGVTDAGMSSAMAAKINEAVEQGANGWNASTLERLAFGSETITPAIIRRLVHNLRSIGMRDVSAFLVYSMTETGPLFSIESIGKGFTRCRQRNRGQVPAAAMRRFLEPSHREGERSHGNDGRARPNCCPLRGALVSRVLSVRRRRKRGWLVRHG